MLPMTVVLTVSAANTNVVVENASRKSTQVHVLTQLELSERALSPVRVTTIVLILRNAVGTDVEGLTVCLLSRVVTMVVQEL